MSVQKKSNSSVFLASSFEVSQALWIAQPILVLSLMLAAEYSQFKSVIFPRLSWTRWCGLPEKINLRIRIFKRSDVVNNQKYQLILLTSLCIWNNLNLISSIFSWSSFKRLFSSLNSLSKDSTSETISPNWLLKFWLKNINYYQSILKILFCLPLQSPLLFVPDNSSAVPYLRVRFLSLASTILDLVSLSAIRFLWVLIQLLDS